MDLIISDADIDDLEKELNALDKRNEWHFDKCRRDAIKNHNDIQACPGSGKTSLVAAKLLLLAKKWNKPYQGVCVLSHTNVAKNEIIKKLQLHPAGQSFLQYPHFIGTIQEFVNKFLGLPCLRSLKMRIEQIDDEAAVHFLANHLHPKGSARIFFERKKTTQNPKSVEQIIQDHIEQVIKYYENGEMVTRISFLKDPTKKTYKELKTLKENAINNGFFFYRELYEYALCLLAESPETISAIRHRFPFVFIDEMQDTERHQDELMNQVFSNSDVIYQRFGDPDQAIFGDGKEANSSYNNNKQLQTIQNSHRFCSTIANLAKGVSCNQINLTSTKTEVIPSGKHTIFLVDERCRDKVLQAFSKLCSTHVDLFQHKKPVIKAVGSVGSGTKKGATIENYFPQFSKKNSTDKYNPQYLIECFLYAPYLSNAHNQIRYKNQIEGVLKLIQLATKEYINKRAFLEWLDNENKKVTFNTLLLQNPKNETDWNQCVNDLLSLLSIDSRDDEKVTKFLAYAENNVTTAVPSISNQNRYLYKDVATGKEICIDIGTIHSVKGETHDATLVLECFYRKNDISTLIRHLLHLEKNQITGVNLLGHAKKIYVAMTRPKHLLCLAVDKSSIYPMVGENLVEQAKRLGWNIIDLTTVNDNEVGWLYGKH